MRRLLAILAAPCAFLVLTAAVCDGQALDSTHDVVMANEPRSVTVCLTNYYGSPIIVNDVFVCQHVQFYPVYGITPGYP